MGSIKIPIETSSRPPREITFNLLVGFDCLAFAIMYLWVPFFPKMKHTIFVL